VSLIIHKESTAAEAGVQAAARTVSRIRDLAERLPVISIVFATGQSQLETLRALVRVPHLPWNRVVGFHMDEYLGISPEHPASFGRYLREELVDRVRFREFHYVDGNAPDPWAFCKQYAARLREHAPQLCLLGIGENGHLAFNDPGEADFADPEDVKIVKLDGACRQQQVNEGWFASLSEVPAEAITMTIPALMRIPELIASVPGERKAAIVQRTLTEPISPELPATILRQHPSVHVYLDAASGARL